MPVPGLWATNCALALLGTNVHVLAGNASLARMSCFHLHLLVQPLQGLQLHIVLSCHDSSLPPDL